MNRKKIEIPLYGGCIIIYQCKDFNEIKKEKDIYQDCSGFDSFVFQDDEGFHLVFLNDATPGFIAHESVHASNKIFKNAHVDLDIENDETQAYMVEWIVEQCHDFLN